MMFEKIRNRVRPFFDLGSGSPVGPAKYFAMALGFPVRAHLNTGSLKKWFAEEKLPVEKRRIEAEKHLMRFKNHPLAKESGFIVPGLKVKKRTVATSISDLYGYKEDGDDDIRGEVLSFLRAGLAGNAHYAGDYRRSPELQIAVASALFVELARLYADLEYISPEECWGLLYINAERVRVSYSDWDDYLNAWENGNLIGFSADEELKQLVAQAVVKAKKIQVEWPNENIFSNLKLIKKMRSVPKVGRK